MRQDAGKGGAADTGISSPGIVEYQLVLKYSYVGILKIHLLHICIH